MRDDGETPSNYGYTYLYNGQHGIVGRSPRGYWERQDVDMTILMFDILLYLQVEIYLG